MDEMKKYIIEFSEDPHTVKLMKIKNGDKFPITEFKTVKPYTEPDLEQIKADWYKAGREAERVRQPDVEQVRKEAYDKCMDEAEMLAYKLYSPKIDEAYQRGINDAWEAARKIRDMTWKEQKEIFGTDIYADIIALSASECIEKIRQYEQRQEEQIQVGDEVNAPFGKAIVVNINSVAEKIWLVYADGHGGFEYFKDAPTKTGRHFPEIAEVLTKMRETDNG